MSASLASIVSPISAVAQAISQVFGGAGTVTLGSVVFTTYEVPEFIAWGGRQRTVKTVLPGGVVTMSLMGVEYPPLAWTGYFNGAGARGRARAVYAMLNAGNQVSLSWGDRLYTVVVSDFTSKEQYSNWIPYSVACEVIRDETLSGGAASQSLLGQLSQDVTSALGLTPDNLAAVQTAISQVQPLVSAASAVFPGSAAAMALDTGLGVAQGTVGGAQALAEGNIGGVVSLATAAGTVFAPGTAASGVASLNTATSNAECVAKAPVINGYLGRSRKNIEAA
jgi:hypothetical protein